MLLELLINVVLALQVNTEFYWIINPLTIVNALINIMMSLVPLITQYASPAITAAGIVLGRVLFPALPVTKT